MRWTAAPLILRTALPGNSMGKPCSASPGCTSQEDSPMPYQIPQKRDVTSMINIYIALVQKKGKKIKFSVWVLRGVSTRRKTSPTSTAQT